MNEEGVIGGRIWSNLLDRRFFSFFLALSISVSLERSFFSCPDLMISFGEEYCYRTPHDASLYYYIRFRSLSHRTYVYCTSTHNCVRMCVCVCVKGKAI